MDRLQIIGFIAALGSAASWAFCTVLFERIGKVIPYAGITFLKGLFSILLLALIALLTGKIAELTLKEFLILTSSGIIGIAIGDTLFFKSLQDLGAKVQVLYFMLGQIITMLLSFLLLDDILSLMEYVGALVLLLGIVLVTWGKQDDHPNKKRGIIGGFLSILCFSVSTILVKETIGGMDVLTATFYRMLFGTLAISLFGITSKKISSWIKPLKEVKTLCLFIINVIVLTFGGFMLSMLAIKNISVSLASVLSTTEPIFVILFAFLINKEYPRLREIAGTAITIGGLLIIIFNGR